MTTIYDKIGVVPVIHCGGTKTTMGGTRMRPEVLEAMADATSRFVSIDELNRAVGRFIAEVTGAEAGMVTSGAASGVVLSAAACMTGTSIANVRRLPDTTGMRDELIIQKTHRGQYSHMYTFTGARFVEVGNTNHCLRAEVEGAFTDRTAALVYLAGPGVSQVGLTVPEAVDVARRAGVPMIIDSAAMLPPRSNLRRYVDQGCDLVVMSGGKLIHGPQNTGLLFGRADLVEAARANAAPNHSIGRPHKVSKEDMVGLYVALQLYLETDEDAALAGYRDLLSPIVGMLDGIPGVRVTIEHDGGRYHVPTAVVRFAPGWTGPGGAAIATRLLAGEPRIFVIHDRGLDELQINPVSLSPAEAEIVTTQLHAVLTEQ